MSESFWKKEFLPILSIMMSFTSMMMIYLSLLEKYSKESKT